MKRWLWPSLIALFVSLFVLRLGLTYVEDPVYFGKSDFTVFYTAAQFSLEQQPLYGNDALNQAITRYRGASGAVRYLYPPIVLVLFIPLALLPFSVAVWAWLVLNVIVLGLLLYLLQKVLAIKFTVQHWAIITGLLVVYGPLFFSLRGGQINLIITAILLLLVWALRGKKNNLAAVLLSSLILIKIYPVILLGYFALKRQWRLMIYTTISCMILFGLAIPLFGWANHQAYIERLPKLISSGIHKNALSRHDNPTLNGLLHRIARVQSAGWDHGATYYKKLIQTTNKAGYSHSTEKMLKYIHLAIVVPLFLALLLATYWHKRSDPLIDLSLWLGFVFLAAKDGHVQYFVLYLPLLIAVLIKPYPWLPKKPAGKLALLFSMMLLSFSGNSLLPLINAPLLVYLAPVALIGNVMILSYVGYHYFHEKTS